ncbi:DUF6115 domain-containing protein [Cerasibacillus sp. JNUCC 74]
MTSFLLLISFLLHIISFSAIYQLFKQVKQHHQSNTTDSNIGALFESYLAEFKEENNRLQQALKQTNHAQLEPDSEENMEEIASTIVENVPMVDDSKEDKVVTSLKANILQLYSKGLSPGEIAKQLNCGKTEAELIIKLHQQ